MRRWSWWLCIVLLLFVTACGSGPGPSAPASASRVTLDVAYTTGGAVLDVYEARGTEGPVFVLLHGCCGGKRDLTQLARGLAAEGATVFNAAWRSLPSGGRFPEVYEEAACAVRFARARAGGRPITVVGWSDGALLGATVALAGDAFGGGGAGARGGGGGGAGCVAGGSAQADAFVGVGAFLGWDGPVDPAQVNDRTTAFFGGGPEAVPEAWRAASPYTHLATRPSLDIRLVVGSDDTLMAANLTFAAAARAAGHRAGVTVIDGAGHLDVLAPSTAPGAAAVRAILGATTAR